MWRRSTGNHVVAPLDQAETHTHTDSHTFTHVLTQTHTHTQNRLVEAGDNPAAGPAAAQGR